MQQDEPVDRNVRCHFGSFIVQYYHSDKPIRRNLCHLKITCNYIYIKQKVTSLWNHIFRQIFYKKITVLALSHPTSPLFQGKVCTWNSDCYPEECCQKINQVKLMSRKRAAKVSSQPMSPQKNKTGVSPQSLGSCWFTHLQNPSGHVIS